MEINKFLRNFAEIFDDEPTEEITFNTVFREIEGWSSITTLGLMSMIDLEYQIKISVLEIREAKTVGDLFNLISSKK